MSAYAHPVGRVIRTPDVWYLVALVFAVLAPLLFQPGFILLHDWAWTPDGMAFSPIRRWDAHEAWGSGAYPPNVMPLAAVLHVVGLALPEQLVQRLFLVTLFALLAAGAWRLAPTTSRWGRLFAATLAVLNPWVFDRFYLGQWFALAGIAVLPWALYALLRALRAETSRPLAWAVLAWGALGVADTHAFVLFAPAPLLAGLVLAWHDRVRARVVLLRVAALYLLTGLVAAYWLWPAAAAPALQVINRADLDFFATQADATFGLLFNVASMHGSWYVEGATKVGLQLWWLLFLGIFALALAGLRAALLDRTFRGVRGEAIAVALYALVAWLLAMGGDGPTGPLYAWAFEHVPGMRGLRDAQRAAFVLPIAYGYLGALGLEALLARVEALRRALYGGLAILFVGVYSLRLLWGGLGEFHPSEYPESWAETREIVAQERDAALLVLPFFRFTRFSFTGELNVINPAPRYFGGVTYAGDNDGTGLPSGVTSDARLRYIEALYDRRDVTTLGNLFSVVGVRYIFVASAPDAEEDRAFLDRQRDLELVREWPDGWLYRNTRPASLIYAARELRGVTDLDALIQHSETGVALSNFAWEWGGAGSSPAPQQPRTDVVRAERSGRFGAYEVIEADTNYVVATLAAPEGAWSLDGRPPLEGTGPVLVYHSRTGTLVRSGVRDLVAGYLVSALAAAMVAGFAFWRGPAVSGEL